MGFRFRRSIKILPGIRLNLGKRSASVSVGARGAHVTLRPGHKARATVGVPGTGLSYTEGGGIKTHPTSPTVDSAPAAGITWRGWLLAALVSMLIFGVVMNNLK